MKRIKTLLNIIGKSNLKFIRNGTKHSGAKAKKHFARKFSYAEDRINTAEDFIKYLATKSSTSGRFYYVEFPDGKKEKLGTWLLKKLKEL